MPQAQISHLSSKKLSRGIAFFKIRAHFVVSLDLQRDFPDLEQEIP